MKCSSGPRTGIVALLAIAASALGGAQAHAGDDNRPPRACMTQSPANPQSGQSVTFSSACSTDPDGRIAGRAWDLDDDGDFDDGTATTAARSWPAPGTYRVRLGVIDNDGSVDTETRNVTVANRGPVAGFSWFPSNPVVGQTVTLTSTSTDADGTLAGESWDLDNDGQFDDATGRSASFVPQTAGSYPVGLRAVDDRGAAATATTTFTVSAAPENAPPPGDPPPANAPAQQFDTSQPAGGNPAPVPIAGVRWLDPFPTVRIRGRTTRAGVSLSLFTVRAPARSAIELRCVGRSCPEKVMRKVVRTNRSAATIRFKALQRTLRAGTQLQVRVTARGAVGKYTGFKIRRLALPVRTDRCLMPSVRRPVACPRAP